MSNRTAFLLGVLVMVVIDVFAIIFSQLSTLNAQMRFVGQVLSQ